MENPMWKAASHRGNCVPVQAVQGFHAHQKSTVVAKSAASTVPQFASAYSCFGWCRKKAATRGRQGLQPSAAALAQKVKGAALLQERCSVPSVSLQGPAGFLSGERGARQKKEEGPGKQQALLAQKGVRLYGRRRGESQNRQKYRIGVCYPLSVKGKSVYAQHVKQRIKVFQSRIFNNDAAPAVLVFDGDLHAEGPLKQVAGLADIRIKRFFHLFFSFFLLLRGEDVLDIG